MMTDDDYRDKFPLTGWLCPYCMLTENESKDCEVDRKDIPGHLVFQHAWEKIEHFNWEHVFNRLSMVGGV